jgi:hypothetical protein
MTAVPGQHAPEDVPSTRGRQQTETRPSSRGTFGAADVDRMLRWVATKDYAEYALGYAVRRIAELGSVEQLVAFTASIRPYLRAARKPTCARRQRHTAVEPHLVGAPQHHTPPARRMRPVQGRSGRNRPAVGASRA